MTKTYIMGIQINNRENGAEAVQHILTEYGCYIKTRLGLHEASETFCSSAGLILLEFAKGNPDEVEAMASKLSQVEGVKIGRMEF